MEAIYAIDSNNGLSKDGIIPWKSKKDLNFEYQVEITEGLRDLWEWRKQNRSTQR